MFCVSVRACNTTKSIYFKYRANKILNTQCVILYVITCVVAIETGGRDTGDAAHATVTV